MKNYDYILFDFDGTLMDTGEGIMNGAKYALSSFGIINISEEDLLRFVGPPLKESFMKLYAFPEDQALEAVRRFRRFYTSEGWKQHKIYPGIVEMLTELKAAGKKLYIASGKPEDLVYDIAEMNNLLGFFEFISGALADGENEKRTQKKDIINHLFENCDISDKSAVIMTGDRWNDILGAKQSGLDSLGILWGYGSLDELKEAGADYVVDTPKNLVKLFL